MIRFGTGVHIGRPPGEVFALVGDPETYPRWNSAVQAVVPDAGGGGRRFRMQRMLPSGPAENLLEIVRSDPPLEFVIRASEGPTPFTYHYRLEAANDGTDLSLDAEVEISGAISLLGPVAKVAVKRGVDVNLGTLRALLERGA